MREKSMMPKGATGFFFWGRDEEARSVLYIQTLGDEEEQDPEAGRVYVPILEAVRQESRSEHGASYLSQGGLSRVRMGRLEPDQSVSESPRPDARQGEREADGSRTGTDGADRKAQRDRPEEEISETLNIKLELLAGYVPARALLLRGLYVSAERNI